MKILEDTAAAADLREGAEGVRSILEAVARRGNTPLKQLARAVRMPLPVVSAVRRELERRGVLARDKGVCLTEQGEQIAAQLGIVMGEHFACAECAGTGFVVPQSLENTLASLRAASTQMPEVNVQLDQAFALPETSVRRAMYALECGALAGRDVVFMGDDDLTSVAAALVLKHTLRLVKSSAKPMGSMVVVDIDERIIGLIRALSQEHELDIECRVHDLRDPLPVALRGRFQVFFTDPPYTLSGLKLFLGRAAEAIETGPGRTGFLSFGHKDADTDIEVFCAIGECGFAPTEIIPAFNEYSGAGIIGNISRMLRLTSGTHVPAAVQGRFTDPIYTGELSVSYRSYFCLGCGESSRVGSDCKVVSIEALKRAGCPRCGEAKFRLRGKTNTVQ